MAHDYFTFRALLEILPDGMQKQPNHQQKHQAKERAQQRSNGHALFSNGRSMQEIQRSACRIIGVINFVSVNNTFDRVPALPDGRLQMPCRSAGALILDSGRYGWMGRFFERQPMTLGTPPNDY
jgi:hypothetical protein